MDRFSSWCKVIASVIQCQLSAMQALNIQIYLFLAFNELTLTKVFLECYFFLKSKKIIAPD